MTTIGTNQRFQNARRCETRRMRLSTHAINCTLCLMSALEAVQFAFAQYLGCASNYMILLPCMGAKSIASGFRGFPNGVFVLCANAGVTQIRSSLMKLVAPACRASLSPRRWQSQVKETNICITVQDVFCLYLGCVGAKDKIKERGLLRGRGKRVSNIPSGTTPDIPKWPQFY